MKNRQTITRGAGGQNVCELQHLLNKALSPSPGLKIDGNFGEETWKAVLKFQNTVQLKEDGIVGKNTWKLLSLATSHAENTYLPQFLLADIANQYIGVRETGKNRAGTSQKMREIFNADDLVVNGKTDGYPWCAAFVSLCIQKLCRQSPFYAALYPPRETSVSLFLNVWAKQNNCLIFKPTDEVRQPLKGDIVVFTFSHIGIVEANRGTMLSTIEGNTNAAGGREGIEVARKLRPPNIIRAFIRLPMTTIGVDRTIQNIAQVC